MIEAPARNNVPDSVDLAKAAALGVGIPEIARLAASANNISAGRLEVGRRQYALRYAGRYDVEQLGELVLAWREGQPVRLSDVAVVELFNPTYDPTDRGVTYDVEVLETWRDDLELGLQEEPADLASSAPAFSAAHLLIDDCPRAYIMCQDIRTERFVSRFPNVPYCWAYDHNVCMPCEPYLSGEPTRCATKDWWTTKCNAQFPDKCQGWCKATFSVPASNNMCPR